MEAWLLGKVEMIFVVFLSSSSSSLFVFWQIFIMRSVFRIPAWYCTFLHSLEGNIWWNIAAVSGFLSTICTKVLKRPFSLNSFCCSYGKETFTYYFVMWWSKHCFITYKSLKIGLMCLSKVCKTNPLLFYVRGFHFKRFALTSSSPH